MEQGGDPQGDVFSGRLSLPRQPSPVYRRGRLHRRIGEALEAGASVWVYGQPGAGKTTLVAGYLEAEPNPALWYTLTSEDADPPTFFRHLGSLLGDRAGSAGLPQWAPNLGYDPLAFARNFFAVFCESLPAKAVLVLDDHHEVEGRGAMDTLVRALLEAFAGHRSCVVISRSRPPETLVRAMARGALECVDGEDLRFSDEEARGIVEKRVPAPLRGAIDVKGVNRRARGWALGLVLLVQQALSGGAAADAAGPAPDTILGYFAGEFASRERDDDLDLLITASLFSYLTYGIARKIAGPAGGAAWIDDLCRKNLFVTRYQSGSGETAFRLHPLFRDYLHWEAARRLSEPELNRRRVLAAATLAESGRREEAVGLYLAGRAWEQAEAELLDLAWVRYQSGEIETLRHWLGALPQERVRRSGWLSLWAGACAAAAEVGAGQEALQRAYALLRPEADATGMLLAWCFMVEGQVLGWSDPRDLDALIADFADLEPMLGRVERPLAGRAMLAMFAAVAARAPYPPRADAWAQRVEAGLRETDEEIARVFGTAQLASFYGFNRGRFEKAAAVVNELAARAGSEESNPVAQIIYLAYQAVVELWAQGEPVRSLETVRKGIAAAEASGIRLLDFLLQSTGAWCALAAGDYDAARHHLGAMGSELNRRAWLNRCVFHDTSALLACHSGDLAAARGGSEQSLEFARRSGMPFAEAACLMTASRVRSLSGEWEEAVRLREAAAAIGRSMDNPFILAQLAWFESSDYLERGREDAAVVALRKGFSAGRLAGLHGNLWLRREELARLCAFALRHEIETDYVRRRIARNRLRAPQAEAGPEWPFVLRVRALGGLKVEVLGSDRYRTLRLKGRPAQLLEALLWLGPESVSQERLSDCLWPDADGDAARRNIDVTAHRLRKALGDDRLLAFEQGRVGLAPGLAWSDLGGLEATRQALVTELQGQPEASRVGALQQRLLDWVDALARTTPESVPAALAGACAARRSEFVSTLDRLAAYWQKQEVWRKEVEALQARVRLEPAAERPHLRMMRIYVAQGLHGEALGAYEACRRNLERSVGIPPGPEIEAAREEILRITNS